MLLRSNNRRTKIGSLPVQVPAIAAHVVTFAAGVGGLTSAEQERLSTLYNDFVNAGVWTRILALNLFLNDSEKCKFNFKDFTKYKASFPSGIGVDALGVFGNGTTQYYRTGFIPAVDAPGLQDNLGVHIFQKMLGVPTSGTSDSFSVSNSNGSLNIRLQSAVITEGKTQHNGFINSAMTVTGASIKTNTHAQISLQRTDANTVSLHQFGQKFVEVTASASSGLPGTYELMGMCRGGSAPSSFTGEYHSHMAITQAFTQAEMVAFNQALMKYHVSAGRVPKSDVFFGDSITHGQGVASFAAWTYKLAALSGTFCQNWGVGGERIGANGATSWAYPANKADWQIPVYNSAIHNRIFLALATNDQVQNMTASQFATDLTYCVNLMKTRGWPSGKIIIIPAYCQRGDVAGTIRQQYITAAQGVGSSTGAFIADGLYTAMKAAPNRDTELYSSGDATHPLAAGHDFIANYLYSVIPS